MLVEIQNLETQLINTPNCGSGSQLFTAMMHKTSEWIDKESNAKAIHVSPFKLEVDKTVELIAYHITCGYNTDEAFNLAGKDSSDFRKTLNDTHLLILKRARTQRLINKYKNK